MAAELIYSSFTPIQIAVIRQKDAKRKEEYEALGYNVEELSNELYHLVKPPKLEMVFRMADQDYIFDMYDTFSKYYALPDMNNFKMATHLAKVFAYRITIGKLVVSISSDGTSYTLNEV